MLQRLFFRESLHDFTGLLSGIEVDTIKVHWAALPVVIDAARDDVSVVLIKKIQVIAEDV